MTFQIEAIHFHVIPMRTRLPFHYGIATLTALPHLIVSVDLVVDGCLVRGQSADGLPPKWFTKNPDTPFELDLAEMVAAIQNASRIGRVAAEKGVLFWRWWRDLYDEQASWAHVREVPPLLAHLGTSLIERAVLDALARAAETPLATLLSTGRIELAVTDLRPGIAILPLAQIIASPPADSVQVRHTVGLRDPLTDSEIPPAERVDDGLPQSLEAAILRHGLRSFKIKLSGDHDHDRHRLASIARLTRGLIPSAASFTVDGNEHYHDMDAFKNDWDQLAADPDCQRIIHRTRFIEQPLHRNHALSDDAGRCLQAWTGRPPIIIDESDGALPDLPRALELGYAGTSHKNCKGLVKGIANAALLRSRPATILSGEDLANVGPVALLQDLAAMTLLGIDDIERNGHHYFRGLSMHTEALQNNVLDTHPDLYQPHGDGFPILKIEGGRLHLRSANEAPFGCALLIDTDPLEPLSAWIKRGGLSEGSHDVEPRQAIRT